MDPDKQVTSDEARRNLRELINAVERDDAHVIITRYGEPAAVIVSTEWHEMAKAALGETEPRNA